MGELDIGTREASSQEANVGAEEDVQGDAPGNAKKHQSRGGKGLVRDEEKRLAKEEEKRKKAKVVIKLVDRNKRKSVTHVGGVEAFGLDLRVVTKRLANKYACGCSVVKSAAGDDEIVIQGDFVDDLMEFLPSEWPLIPSDQIVYVPKPSKK
jgi:density-regulated protein DRP1